MIWSVQCSTLEKHSAVYSYLMKRWLCLVLPSFYPLVIIVLLFIFPAHIYDHKHKHAQEKVLVILHNNKCIECFSVLSNESRSDIQEGV